MAVAQRRQVPCQCVYRSWSLSSLSRAWNGVVLIIGVLSEHGVEEVLGLRTLVALEHLRRRALLEDRALVEEHIRSATSRAKPISWVTTIIGMCRSVASDFITASTSPVSSGSSAEVGSSKSMTSGFIASARAIATRCC